MKKVSPVLTNISQIKKQKKMTPSWKGANVKVRKIMNHEKNVYQQGQ